MGSLVLTASSFARASFWPRPRYDSELDPRTSEVGTDLRAVRHRRHGAFGEIALPPELAGECSAHDSANDSMGWAVLAAPSSARALLFARSGSQARASSRPAPRSRLVLRKNPPRHPGSLNGIVLAQPERQGVLEWEGVPRCLKSK